MLKQINGNFFNTSNISCDESQWNFNYNYKEYFENCLSENLVFVSLVR